MNDNMIPAAANPELANQMLAQANAGDEQLVLPAAIKPPSDVIVTLPGGYLLPTGEVATTVEVRELNGKDEEAIARTGNLNRIFNTVLNRAVVRIGDLPATEKLIDNMLVGDQQAALIGIYKATFGDSAVIASFCNGCNDWKDVEINVNTDINTRVLTDPVGERRFTVKSRNNEYLVVLPTGVTQKEITSSSDKNYAEITTTILENTVLEINGRPVLSKIQVQNLGIVDRKAITEEIAKRTPGPKFEDVKVTCPDCESEVVVPLNLGTLFRF